MMPNLPEDNSTSPQEVRRYEIHDSLYDVELAPDEIAPALRTQVLNGLLEITDTMRELLSSPQDERPDEAQENDIAFIKSFLSSLTEDELFRHRHMVRMALFDLQQMKMWWPVAMEAFKERFIAQAAEGRKELSRETLERYPAPSFALFYQWYMMKDPELLGKIQSRFRQD